LLETGYVNTLYVTSSRLPLAVIPQGLGSVAGQSPQRAQPEQVNLPVAINTLQTAVQQEPPGMEVNLAPNADSSPENSGNSSFDSGGSSEQVVITPTHAHMPSDEGITDLYEHDLQDAITLNHAQVYGIPAKNVTGEIPLIGQILDSQAASPVSPTTARPSVDLTGMDAKQLKAHIKKLERDRDKEEQSHTYNKLSKRDAKAAANRYEAEMTEALAEVPTANEFGWHVSQNGQNFADALNDQIDSMEDYAKVGEEKNLALRIYHDRKQRQAVAAQNHMDLTRDLNEAKQALAALELKDGSNSDSSGSGASVAGPSGSGAN
jgi:hypothetical protein